ncbi:MAG: hypothetical protein NTX65_00665 [Ignavibacteriales bacterium]|nr:hypothetical protein [Ignavibacteriales bacterium]
MKSSFIKYFFGTLLLLTVSSTLNAQTFGFGCLGLSGFYAGISQESYNASGINDHLNVRLFNLQSGDAIKFEKGTGYRVGANFIRVKFDKVFISAKGYYQFLKEEHTTSVLSSGSNLTSTHTLSMNHWGVGIDFGVKLFWILDWKVVEGDVTFYNGDFTSEYSKDNIFQSDEKYNLDKTKVGYYLGSGLILHIIPDYISLEGTAGYNFLKLESMKRTDSLGNEIFINNAVPSGGFSATIQLNVGFPF